MRFGSVYFLLLMAAGLCAFALPQQMGDRARPMMGALVAPVAWPARQTVLWATGRRNAVNEPVEVRSDSQLRDENEELRYANQALAVEVERLRKLNDERGKLGNIRDRCTPVDVLGASDPPRNVLTIRSRSELRDGMFVLSTRDVVGRLSVGKVSAQVRLVTDSTSHVEAYFGTYRKDVAAPDAGEAAIRLTRLDLPNRVCDGVGGGRIVCRNLPYADVEKAGLRVGDWAIIDDAEWQPLQGRRLGVVTKISASAKLMAEIELKPEADLMKLSEVMVLTK